MHEGDPWDAEGADEDEEADEHADDDAAFEDGSIHEDEFDVHHGAEDEEGEFGGEGEAFHGSGDEGVGGAAKGEHEREGHHGRDGDPVTGGEFGDLGLVDLSVEDGSDDDADGEVHAGVEEIAHGGAHGVDEAIVEGRGCGAFGVIDAGCRGGGDGGCDAGLEDVGDAEAEHEEADEDGDDITEGESGQGH